MALAISAIGCRPSIWKHEELAHSVPGNVVVKPHKLCQYEMELDDRVIEKADVQPM